MNQPKKYCLTLTGGLTELTPHLPLEQMKPGQAGFRAYGTPADLLVSFDEQVQHLRNLFLQRLTQLRIADSAAGVPQGGRRG